MFKKTLLVLVSAALLLAAVGCQCAPAATPSPSPSTSPSIMPTNVAGPLTAACTMIGYKAPELIRQAR